MNQDSPKEVLTAARFHQAGPFDPNLAGMRMRLALIRPPNNSLAGGFPLARVVWYPKNEMCRGQAWDHLLQQQIPGCPGGAGQRGNRWCRMHTENYWAWYYR